MASWTGVVALASALAIYVDLLARIRAADTDPPPWWFGYARDGANLAAAFLLWGAHLMLGFSSATALCAAMLTTLATYILDWAVARVLRVRRIRVVLALSLFAWVAFVALAPATVNSAFAGLIAAVQPR